MKGQPLSNWNNRPAQVAGAGSESTSRRSVHGSSAWSLPIGTNALRQPQDGAQAGVVSAARALLTSIRHGNPLAEPDDAKMTGGTRSLTRRLLGLNVMAAPRKAPLSAISVLAKRQIA